MEHDNDWLNPKILWFDPTLLEIDRFESVKLTWQNDLRNSGYDFETFDSFENFPSINETFSVILDFSIGQNCLPRVHDLDQLAAIYLYSMSPIVEEEWTKNYSKIGGIARNSDELIKYIKGNQYRKQRITIEVEKMFLLNVFAEKSDRSICELNGSFLWFQLMLDILHRTTVDNDEGKSELISFCRKYYENNHRALVAIDEFKENYRSTDAIQWYTRESFVYRLLNQSFRRESWDVLFAFRFFIQDLHSELKRTQCEKKIEVYRGQRMTSFELNQLKNSINQLVSMNTFLSTSLDRNIAQVYLNPGSGYESILFKITANPQHTINTPFADISSYSYFQEEHEVLFMPGMIFRTISVVLDSDCGIWIVHLDSVSEEENESKVLYEHLKAEKNLHGNDPLAFGQLLIDMGRFDQAEQYFQRCLNKKPPIDLSTLIYATHSLGVIAYEKGNYDESLNLHNKVLALKKKHSSISVKIPLDANYNSLAIIYEQKKNYKLALQFFQKSFRICRKELPKVHPKLARCLNNIAGIHQLQQNYKKALKFAQDALKIREKCLPSDHPDLAVSYGNLGVISRSLGQHKKALKYYDRSLRIYWKSSPNSHPHLASILTNAGLVYEDIAQYDRAMIFYRRACKILTDSFLTTHPHMQKIGDFIRRVSRKIHGNIFESTGLFEID